MEQQNGILVLDKPKGLSSGQCVGRLKRLGQKKIGHGGTLDPMATGVLLILLGQATKISNYLLVGGHKIYQGVLRLGVTTDTWDIEGRTLSEHHVPDAAAEFEERIRQEVRDWILLKEQPVPPYSAAKHQGRPLYKLARAGKEVPAKVKEITISHAEVQWVDLPQVRFRVTCSSGSYIRSLAHSLGTRLECGAALAELTRLYSHPFGLEEAVSLDDLLDNHGLLAEKVLPLRKALPDWRIVKVSPREEADIRNGKALPHLEEHGLFRPGDKAIVHSMEDLPLALAEAVPEQGRSAWRILRGLF